jgi:hypothetical protein
MAEVNEPSEDGVRSRGNVLALLGGAIAGAVAGALGRPERALGGHDGTNVMHLGESNATPVGFGTGVTADADAFALSVINDHTGVQAGGVEVRSQGTRSTLEVKNLTPGPATAAVLGVSELPGGGTGDGTGMFGAGGVGVWGTSPSGIGVRADSDTGDAIVGEAGHFGVHARGTLGGVIGRSESGVGVDGTSATFVGVFGHSEQGNGVAGECNDAAGVGTSGSSTDGIGVHAVSQNGQALRVEGRAMFSTAGSGTVPQGQHSVFVSNPAVTAGSHVSVTLVGNPGNRELRWVQRSPGSGFTVNLTPAPPNQRPATAFTYLIVEPAA